MWSTGEGNGKSLQYSCCKNPMNSMKRQTDMTPEDTPLRSEGVWYATGEELRAITNSSRKNEAARLKQKWCSAVNVSGSESNVQYCKEQYCTGSWNVRSMYQNKLDVIKPWAFPGGASGKALTCQCKFIRDAGSTPGWAYFVPSPRNPIFILPLL